MVNNDVSPLPLGRRELLALIAALMALMALGIDMLLPAFDDIRVAYGLAEDSSAPGQLITVYFIGLAVAQLFFGPLTDWYGRKPIIFIGIFIFIIGSIGSALAPNFATLLVLRFVWGIGAAGTRVVAVAVVRDCFEGSQMAKAMSEVMAVFVLVPVIAPTFGAGLIAIFPWESIFWFSAVFAVGMSFWSLRLPETLKPEYKTRFSWASTKKGYARVCRTRVTAFYTLSSVCLQAVFVMYLSSSERIISDILGRGDQFPIIFGVVAIMFGITALINGKIVMALGIQKLLFGASLFLVFSSTVLLVATMVKGGSPGFWLFIPILAVVLSTFMFIMPNLNSAALFPMGDIAGTAGAFTSAIRMSLGAAIGGVMNSVIEESLTPFAVGVVCMAVLTTLTIFVAGDPEPERNHLPN
ncbi:MAG: MFS transporter [Acidimicrobiales bacterium]|jgi:DHA1 family bicyclomycin/chloramphenicol resistance-like MFS transporter|nr:MFS transporter [Acidimicrobiales bacterium]MDP6299469.1 MFS transporter [Acidimicrobiales bacterium]HJM29292.1 MFS transporter [Acidimicrobiales bacterium]HJM98273.1 MFS transporter [Acidimicrobiales bacterium]